VGGGLAFLRDAAAVACRRSRPGLSRLVSPPSRCDTAGCQVLLQVFIRGFVLEHITTWKLENGRSSCGLGEAGRRVQSTRTTVLGGDKRAAATAMTCEIAVRRSSCVVTRLRVREISNSGQDASKNITISLRALHIRVRIPGEKNAPWPHRSRPPHHAWLSSTVVGSCDFSSPSGG